MRVVASLQLQPDALPHAGAHRVTLSSWKHEYDYCHRLHAQLICANGVIIISRIVWLTMSVVGARLAAGDGGLARQSSSAGLRWPVVV